jgi:hypothetical protein
MFSGEEKRNISYTDVRNSPAIIPGSTKNNPAVVQTFIAISPRQELYLVVGVIMILVPVCVDFRTSIELHWNNVLAEDADVSTRQNQAFAYYINVGVVHTITSDTSI